MPATIQWWRGGTPRETSSHPGGPPAGAPAPACSIAAVTLSDQQPGRGVTQSPGAGPGASCLSTRRGTPMPAGCPPGSLRNSWTRTRTGTPLPRGRRALPYHGLPSPRPTRTGPTTSLLAGLQAPHVTSVRTPVEVPPQTRRGGGPVPECPRPTPGWTTRAVSKYFDQPGPTCLEPTPTPAGPRQAPRDSYPAHDNPGRTDHVTHDSDERSARPK